MGWLVEGDNVAQWRVILFWIFSFSIAPILLLLVTLLTPKENKYIRLFSWSVFGIFSAELCETIWCRIPNNEVCENSIISTILVSLIISHGIYKTLLIMQSKNERFLAGFGLGIAASKTILSKIWWAKFLSLFKPWI